MICAKCDKNIDEDSKFCQHCGAEISNLDSKQESKQSQQDDEQVVPPVAMAKVDLLWEKFAEVYDARDDERRKFDELSSPHIWELLERLSTNAFEDFISSNKDELNKQPYKTIEALKNLYTLAVLGGYRLEMSESIQQDENLKKFRSFSLDEFIEEWKQYDFDEAIKVISEEMSICISKYLNFRIDDFMATVSEAKELTNETVDKLKNSILFQILNGYHAGRVEDKFRK